ncbi:hypothetical protein GUJ93_ZPchr0006g41733 [Zizania palustris]|uniref:Uncharacterized protein n=1 Tax=Zizania palustris TaxID=103762 RepID=A0A8J5T9D5_ZIZPA|nr:hypothetical protein GUJ93_ZPchr0006g41733 [Zizania palustris]
MDCLHNLLKLGMNYNSSYSPLDVDKLRKIGVKAEFFLQSALCTLQKDPDLDCIPSFTTPLCSDVLEFTFMPFNTIVYNVRKHCRAEIRTLT